LKSKRNLAVFTTGVMAEMELLGCENLTVYSTGGLLSPPTAVYVGPHTIEFLKSLHVDKYFVSANSFNVERGVTDPFMLEAEVKRQCALVADRVYLLVDYSKFGKASTMPSIAVSKIHLIMTDHGCPTAYMKELDRAGLKYMVAPVSSSAD
jgi:DeoR/GlpR family transcriptional regulator of sugar metabolism